jgi:fucose 4-O-acetylase-like acetyltransferase
MDDNASTGKRNKLFFLDNLRTFIIFLVVLYHVGWVYERSGILSSVWIVNDPLKNDLAGILNLIADIFMMPVMFFISGYFIPLSLKTKTGWTFIKSRFARLMIPWIIAVLTLIPLYKIIFLYSRNLSQQNFASYFHFTGGSPINQGWLWFLPLLFLFNVIYSIFSKINIIKFKYSLKAAVFTVFIIGIIYSSCMTIFKLSGWTKTFLLDFQNERILVYFMTFLFGSLCYKLNIFETSSKKKILYIVLCATVWIPMNIYIIFLLNLLFNPGKYIISFFADIILVWIGFHLSMLSLMYIMINTFRYFFNKAGKLMKQLNDYSYGVYIIHFVVVGGIALITLNTNLPSILKYLVLIVSAYTVSNLIVAFYRLVVQKI